MLNVFVNDILIVLLLSKSQSLSPFQVGFTARVDWVIPVLPVITITDLFVKMTTNVRKRLQLVILGPLAPIIPADSSATVLTPIGTRPSAPWVRDFNR